jgi:hypothetical protein
MTIQQQVIRILRGPVAARIRFAFPDGMSGAAGRVLTVTPTDFHVVSRAIEAGTIHVVTAVDLPAGWDAQYNRRARTRRDGTRIPARTIELSRMTGRYAEGSIVHECLHAYYDLTGAALSTLNNEASAFVTSSLYYRMTELPPIRTNDIDQLGANVADGLLAQYGTGDAHPTVPEPAWGDLLDAIRSAPSYARELGLI